jgi:hypothetical protein
MVLLVAEMRKHLNQLDSATTTSCHKLEMSFAAAEGVIPLIEWVGVILEVVVEAVKLGGAAVVSAV